LRFTEGAIETSYSYRLGLMMDALKSVSTRPQGTARINWLMQYPHVPHNDFFYILGIYGLPGAGLFVTFITIVILTIKRMTLSIDKVYNRTVLTFLIIAGLSLTQIAMKHYWIFMALILANDYLVRNETENEIDDAAYEHDEYDQFEEPFETFESENRPHYY
jgi:O-antigen ligase